MSPFKFTVNTRVITDIGWCGKIIAVFRDPKDAPCYVVEFDNPADCAAYAEGLSFRFVFAEFALAPEASAPTA